MISYITIYQALALLVSFEYIFLIMGPARSTMTMAMLSYTKTLAPGIGGGQYAYGAAIALILIVIGIAIAPVALVLLFLFFYKLGDNMATALATPFYLDMGFSRTEIGSIAKIAALCG